MHRAPFEPTSSVWVMINPARSCKWRIRDLMVSWMVVGGWRYWLRHLHKDLPLSSANHFPLRPRQPDDGALGPKGCESAEINLRTLWQGAPCNLSACANLRVFPSQQIGVRSRRRRPVRDELFSALDATPSTRPMAINLRYPDCHCSHAVSPLRLAQLQFAERASPQTSPNSRWFPRTPPVHTIAERITHRSARRA